MNAAETIAAAIEKLVSLKATSTPGPWREEDHADEFVGFIVGDGYKLATEISIIEDGQLIVTLHRTIDAQLALLRAILKVHLDSVPLIFDEYEVWPIPAYALDLARAILGEDS